MPSSAWKKKKNQKTTTNKKKKQKNKKQNKKKKQKKTQTHVDYNKKMYEEYHRQEGWKTIKTQKIKYDEYLNKTHSTKNDTI